MNVAQKASCPDNTSQGLSLSGATHLATGRKGCWDPEPEAGVRGIPVATGGADVPWGREGHSPVLGSKQCGALDGDQ